MTRMRKIVYAHNLRVLYAPDCQILMIEVAQSLSQQKCDHLGVVSNLISVGLNLPEGLLCLYSYNVMFFTKQRGSKLQV